MSFRTKLIMDMVNQQASDSCVDTVEYIIGEDGTLSPIYTQLPSSVNDPILNNINNEAPQLNISNNFKHIELPTDFNDAESINSQPETIIILNNNLEAPPPNIPTSFDHLDLPTDINDVFSINNELENPENLETEQDKNGDSDSNITNSMSFEHDDLDVSYVPEENECGNSSADEDDNSGKNRV
ncbi:unnamed protein product [Psylliodes chrysocephalus]|uniref:Uncharacterized protein n=1 Tax=Psylliodes chrysocephalus TaxID=3402493 RepID=A0A9P0DCN8_9CUCU|nr:unnamed protein product [Psylliodes chrysocephala]